MQLSSGSSRRDARGGAREALVYLVVGVAAFAGGLSFFWLRQGGSDGTPDHSGATIRPPTATAPAPSPTKAAASRPPAPSPSRPAVTVRPPTTVAAVTPAPTREVPVPVETVQPRGGVEEFNLLLRTHQRRINQLARRLENAADNRPEELDGPSQEELQLLAELHEAGGAAADELGRLAAGLPVGQGTRDLLVQQFALHGEIQRQLQALVLATPVGQDPADDAGRQPIEDEYDRRTQALEELPAANDYEEDLERNGVQIERFADFLELLDDLALGLL